MRATLETHKSALDIAVDMAALYGSNAPHSALKSN